MKNIFYLHQSIIDCLSIWSAYSLYVLLPVTILRSVLKHCQSRSFVIVVRERTRTILIMDITNTSTKHSAYTEFYNRDRSGRNIKFVCVCIYLIWLDWKILCCVKHFRAFMTREKCVFIRIWSFRITMYLQQSSVEFVEIA